MISQKAAVSQTSKKADQFGLNGDSVTKTRHSDVNAMAKITFWKNAAAVAKANNLPNKCREVWKVDDTAAADSTVEDIHHRNQSASSFAEKSSWWDANSHAKMFHRMKTKHTAVAEVTPREKYEMRLNQIMGAVICCNAVSMAVELDYGPDAGAPVKDRIPWILVESVFIVAFLFELGLRIHWDRYDWVKSYWNWMDAGVILVGIIDCWILNLINAADSNLRMVTLFRLARLVRLLRVAKLVRAFRTFYVTVMAFRDAVMSMVNILVLITVGLFLCAIFTTSTIGKSDDLRKLQMGEADGDERFGSIPKSMYSLFELMTLEGWEQVGRPLVREEPAMGIFLFLFIMVFTFGLLNMIVAMVVEKTLLNQRKMDEHLQAEKHSEIEQNLLEMESSFDEADRKKAGYLDLETFEEQMKDESSMIYECLRKAGVPTDDPIALFYILDENHDGHLSYPELLGGCARIHAADSYGALALQAELRTVHRHVKKLRSDVRASHTEPKRKFSGSSPYQSRQSASMELASVTNEDISQSRLKNAVRGKPSPPPPCTADVLPPVSNAPEITVVDTFYEESPSRKMPGAVPSAPDETIDQAHKGTINEESEKFETQSSPGSPGTSPSRSVVSKANALGQMDTAQNVDAEATLREILSVQLKILERIDSVDAKQEAMLRRVTSVEDALEDIRNWIGADSGGAKYV